MKETHKKEYLCCNISSWLKIVIDTPFFWFSVTLILSLMVYLITKDKQSSVLTGTAILIFWYSWETSLLRKQTKRQNDLNEKPVLNLYLREKYGKEYFALRNVSSLSAYNIRVKTVIDPFIDKYDYRFYFKEANFILEPNGDEKSLDMMGGIIMHDIQNFKNQLFQSSFKPEDNIKKKFALFLIHYKNISGEDFYSIFKLYSKIPVLTDDFIIDFVDSDIGCISEEEALKKCKELPIQESVFS